MKLDCDIKTKGAKLDFDLGDKITIDMGNIIVQPLTVTENGEYIGGEQDGKRVAYNPVSVNVPLPVEPLTVKENGVYEAEQGKGFNIVNVNVQDLENKERAERYKSIVDRTVVDLTPEYLEEFTTVVSRMFIYGGMKYVEIPSNILSIGIQAFRYSSVEEVYIHDGVLSIGDFCFANTSKMTHIRLPNTIEALRAGALQGAGIEELIIPPSIKAFGADMAAGCSKLKTIKADFRNLLSATNGLVSGCSKLETVEIKNIGVNLQVGSGTSWGHLLTQESALSLCFQCRNTGSTKTITFAKPVFDNLATLYVKYVDITEEMRADDDLIDEKYPFVLCESTDEGAMTIATYMTNKMWAIARG